MIVPTSSEDYTVAWIAALPHERAAGEMMLDQEYERPESFTKNAGDPNRYSWGRIGEHLVVIASLPAGEYGTTTTAITAQGLRSSLPHIRVGLLVGIGAGVPGETCHVDSTVTVRRDIRLGDVVVSIPDGTNGGVVQYDLVKAKGSFERKGSLNSPPMALLNALSALQAKHDYRDSKMPSIISGALVKYPRAAPKYSRPIEEPDRLFKACCSHTGGENCRDCDQTGQISRAPREDFQIHYGTIACGNTLVKDAVYRDEVVSWLRKQNVDPLCFEMEAAGLMNAFPCLVIRGICDYGDSHKNDAWQRHAAITAAAFAKEYLGFVDVEEVRRAPSLDQLLGESKSVKVVCDIFESGSANEALVERKIDDALQGNRKIQSTLHTARDDGRRVKIIKWLSPSDPSTNYNRAFHQRHEGTGHWFLESDEFKRWKASSESFLWLHGIPGCGKTVLSSTIIEHLKQDTTCHLLLYFYFDFNDGKKQSLDDLLRSLIEQVYQLQPESRQSLEKIWTSHDEGIRQPSTSSLQSVLQDMLSGVGSVSIVLDALDESKPREELLAWLKTLIQSTHVSCRLLVISRREEDIESAFQSWTHAEERILIQQDEVNKDISTYVIDRVRNGDDLKRWRSRPDLQKEIETRLMKKAGGMFRWAACQIEALRSCYDQSSLRIALGNLPDTLDETYARILQSIPENNKRDATAILRLLIWSQRPLRLEEMVDAIAVQPDAKPSFDPDNRMPEPRDILRICSSLATLVQRPFVSYIDGVADIDGDDSGGGRTVTELRLAHFSVKEYLISDRITLSFSSCLADRTARASIATLCLAYLSSLDHSLPLDELRARFKFSQYCARYWTIHASVVDEGGDGADNAIHKGLQTRILKFLNESQTAYLTCYNLYDPDGPWLFGDERRKMDKPAPLYYTSLTGLVLGVTLSLGAGADVNAEGGQYRYALHAASYKGYDRIVQVLLNGGADVNAKGGHYSSALQAASYKGREKIVQTLLDEGVDVNV
ncbi:Pfs, NACHT and ankyrin domain protein [Aureobasidium sp. EXF-8845]|nr:Pfs, NACHT and ankyrin domain protein [Aureobasidium sp. EXF-8845]KAI4857870.1 Pfs, NACHT and ankyrin domain protein [Aureobasidium sp. EXF-8846]